MIDKEVLEEKLKLLTEYISDLVEEQKNISLEKLKENKIHRRYIERTLHLAVEACLDIGNHIIAELQLREPEDYKDIMAVLCDAGYLPPGSCSGRMYVCFLIICPLFSLEFFSEKPPAVP
ncbi:hypothetical protein Tph_c02940 [Thermacetogenium phaeum DSM 12270]|jgi:uncharacterized protein YutE (UPF0331/DUF86 family)|uniref:DUF86 domain-containing protein n=1 Tax=Thermacetogenium phaeum (strain ATCC BAA-254 / DSM 26808 / PB) TaxID=1089553 RepID=K4LC80_THEPS|nr:HepT-like ribonuclease domain-containing protein [Thermacetogenium phaeum]AFV10541.1 hypothetical protein Tph_c02940 [Thermacetogenium phaeum DSM 12270]